MTDWKIFLGDGSRHQRLTELPPPPPWRFARESEPLDRPKTLDLDYERSRAAPFIPTEAMILAVNAALYLRRPLLITGKPGSGKSTLISKVADELQLGPVIRWPIGSRSTVREGVYDYDAVGRLQAHSDIRRPVADYLKLGPLATALNARSWPRPLLIDEIDKSDLDFANDLLNVIEEGECDIPELRRLDEPRVEVLDALKERVTVEHGSIRCGQFPFVVMTSNAEREFPPPFLRRCVRLHIAPPGPAELTEIVRSHLRQYPQALESDEIQALIEAFDRQLQDNREVATDQLLNAVFLTVAMRDRDARQFTEQELADLRQNLLEPLSGPAV